MSTSSDWQHACFDVVAREVQDEHNEKSSDRNIRGAKAVSLLGGMWPNGQVLLVHSFCLHPIVINSSMLIEAELLLLGHISRHSLSKKESGTYY